jgi:hypothetical protein
LSSSLAVEFFLGDKELLGEGNDMNI